MKKGFTLIEILIAVGIFSIMVLLTTGAFLSISSTSKSLQTSQEVLNELRFAIDLMGQEILAGSSFVDENDSFNACKHGCDNIVFASKVRPDIPLTRVHYYLDDTNGVIMKGQQRSYGECSILGGFWGPGLRPECFQPFTSDNVEIETLQFFVNNNNEADKKVIISIVIQGKILPGTNKEQEFKISTSFSPRLGQNPGALPPLDNVPPVIEITSPTSNDTYTASTTSLSLGGKASDNRGITELLWRNETTSVDGTMSSVNPSLPTSPEVTAFWSTPSISLKRASDNLLKVEAKDAEGISGTDTLLVRCIAPPATPGIIDLHTSCSCGNPRIYLKWSASDGADKYYIYKNGLKVRETTKLEWNDTRVSPGQVITYAVRAYSSYNGGLLSPASTRTITVGSCRVPQCADGLDNDGDLAIDLADSCCSNTCDTSENNSCGTSPPPGDTGDDTGNDTESDHYFKLYSTQSRIQAVVSGATSGNVSSSHTTIRHNSYYGFSSSVRLSASVNISGASVIQDGSSPSDLYVRLPDKTAPGTYYVRVSGSSGNGSCNNCPLTIPLWVKAGGGGSE